jgi:hypothetical protein
MRAVDHHRGPLGPLDVLRDYGQVELPGVVFQDVGGRIQATLDSESMRTEQSNALRAC